MSSIILLFFPFFPLCTWLVGLLLYSRLDVVFWGILAYLLFAMLSLSNIWTAILRRGTACINSLPILRTPFVQHAIDATLRYTTISGTDIYAQILYAALFAL